MASVLIEVLGPKNSLRSFRQILNEYKLITVQSVPKLRTNCIKICLALHHTLCSIKIHKLSVIRFKPILFPVCTKRVACFSIYLPSLGPELSEYVRKLHLPMAFHLKASSSWGILHSSTICIVLVQAIMCCSCSVIQGARVEISTDASNFTPHVRKRINSTNDIVSKLKLNLPNNRYCSRQSSSLWQPYTKPFFSDIFGSIFGTHLLITRLSPVTYTAGPPSTIYAALSATFSEFGIGRSHTEPGGKE
jgi:hypothetical protein